MASDEEATNDPPATVKGGKNHCSKTYTTMAVGDDLGVAPQIQVYQALSSLDKLLGGT